VALKGNKVTKAHSIPTSEGEKNYKILFEVKVRNILSLSYEPMQ
jgi:hypothetical protein